MEMDSSSIHLAKLAENEPGQWELADAVFIVAKSRQILAYLWIICGLSVDYLWMFLSIFLVEDLQS